MAAHRFIEEPSERLFETPKAERPSMTWKFEATADLAAWGTPDRTLLAIDDGSLRVSPGSDRDFVRLTRRIKLDTAEIDFLSVHTKGLRRGRLRLFWAAPGESFDQARSLRLNSASATGGAATHTFDLRRHPEWRGRVKALRLDLPDVEGQVFRVSSITLGRSNTDAESLARLVDGDWKVELGHEVRNAILGPPGMARRWRLPKGATGQLRFAIGLPASSGRAVTFRLSTEGGKALYEAEIDPRGDGAGRWRDVVVELKDPVEELVFETEAGPEYRIESGIPAWANPEILRDSARRPPNVILVSLDTLRADRLSLYGYEHPTSPRLEAWAQRRAVTFQRAVATAPWTLPSHVSILSGLDALSHGVNYELPASHEVQMLPETLRSAGYLTLAVTGGGWIHPRNGMAQGFDRFHYWSGGAGGANEMATGVDRALGLLEEHADRPFFLFLHTYEAHDPYHPRMPYARRCFSGEDAEEGGAFLYGATPLPRRRDDGFPLFYRFVRWKKGEKSRTASRMPEEDLPLVSCLYDSGVAFLDEQIGRLFDGLRELDLERDTVVVLTSDHGESLGENGLVKHAYLTDTNLLVPLVIALPKGRHAGRVVEAQVSTVDIYPTVLSLLGIETGEAVDGVSLEPLIADSEPPRTREAWSYAGASNFGLSLRVNDRAKYIVNDTAWTPLAGQEHLYQLRDDAAEQRDVAADGSPDLEGLRRRAREYLRSKPRGVRAIVENDGCAGLEGQFRGRSIHLGRVKSGDPDSVGLDWIGNHTAGYRLAAGESLNVLVEAARAKLVASGTAERCGNLSQAPFEIELPLDELDEPRELTLTGDGWLEKSAEKSLARVVVRREGRKATTSPQDDIDPALLEQLRALGYVE